MFYNVMKSSCSDMHWSCGRTLLLLDKHSDGFCLQWEPVTLKVSLRVGISVWFSQSTVWYTEVRSMQFYVGK